MSTPTPNPRNRTRRWSHYQIGTLRYIRSHGPLSFQTLSKIKANTLNSLLCQKDVATDGTRVWISEKAEGLLDELLAVKLAKRENQDAELTEHSRALLAEVRVKAARKTA